ISLFTPTSRWLAALAVTLLVTQTLPASDKPVTCDEATRVRFVIVCDTDAEQGDVCGLDGSNVKAVLEAGLKKQKLDGRWTIDMLTGRDVTPGGILEYFQKLKVEPHEALVFYYAGHGAYHLTKGHLLTLSHGDLARSSLLAAMQKHKPRLAVLLTDCC